MKKFRKKYQKIDHLSRFIMLELVLDVGVSIPSEVTDISNDKKMKEVFEELLSDFIPK